MKSLSRLWPFRTYTNFSISLFGVIAVGYVSYTVYSEKAFNKPIIGETIKIMSKNEQIKSLIGFPLSYRYTLSNKFSQKPDESYYLFQVKGPRSKTVVEMTTSSLPVSEIYSYGEKHPKIAALQQKIKENKQYVNNLEQKIKIEPSKNKKKDFILQKSATESKINQLYKLIQDAQVQIQQKKKKYFVPQGPLYTNAIDFRSKNSPKQVEKSQRLWGINDLVVNLPNRSKITIFPKPEKSLEEKKKLLLEPRVETLTLGHLNERLSLDMSNFSREEIEEYGKQKTSFMYQKYSLIRSFSVFFAAAFAIGFISYYNKNSLKSIKGSILENQVKTILLNHQKMKQICIQKNKNISFDNLIAGGMKGNYFKCVIDVKGLPNGKLFFEGKYSDQLNQYIYDQLNFSYRDKNKKIEIDLLK